MVSRRVGAMRQLYGGLLTWELICIAQSQFKAVETDVESNS